MSLRIGNWLFERGDLYRIVMWNVGPGIFDRSPVLANWSRPRIDWLIALTRRLA